MNDSERYQGLIGRDLSMKEDSNKDLFCAGGKMKVANIFFRAKKKQIMFFTVFKKGFKAHFIKFFYGIFLQRLYIAK